MLIVVETRLKFNHNDFDHNRKLDLKMGGGKGNVFEGDIFENKLNPH